MARKNGGRKAQKEKQTEIEIEQRRIKVAQGIMQGFTYRQLAIQLNVSPATIASDRKAIIAEWKTHYTDKADQWIQIQLRRLDTMINAIWADAIGAVEGKKVSLSHMDRVVRLMERQERLLGIGGPIEERADVNIRISIDDFADTFKEMDQYREQRYGDSSPDADAADLVH